MVLGSLFAQEDSHATTAWLLIGKKGIHFHLAGILVKQIAQFGSI
jgi:hypothetical protein